MLPELYWIQGPWPGKLAISPRPRGGDWLEDEIEGWKKAGVDIVASLLTSEETRELDLGRESALAEARALRFMSFPIPDRGVPPSLDKVAKWIESVRGALMDGRSVLVHCRQGIGRSGLIAAALLGLAGADAKEAMRRVSEARGVPVPETEEQQDWVGRFLQKKKGGSSR